MVKRKERKEKKGHYYGLAKIAERLGICQITVRTWITKYSLPVYHRPCSWVPGNLIWYTNEFLILNWEQSRIEETRARFVATKTGQRQTYTRRHQDRHPGQPLIMVSEPSTPVDQWLSKVD